jgi:putative glutamine transport system permease protein
MNSEIMTEWVIPLWVGVLWTLRLMSASFIFASVLALPSALARLSTRRSFRWLGTVYVEVVRGMPALTLLLLIYFGLPPVGISLSADIAAILGLGLNGAAYISEIYRAGIQAIDVGQKEAAQMVGMRNTQVMRYVILPQAFRIVVPPLTNYSISLLKATSVASLISAPELMLQARDLASTNFKPLQVYMVVGAIYLLMAFPLSLLMKSVEAKFKKQSA